HPSSGEVRFGGDSVLRLPPERRGAVLVFQKPLLFPYLTVGENIAFGLRMRKVSAPEIQERVAEALGWVQLEGYQDRSPATLSGGQEQRVSLARSLVTRPRVLLLDEPFSALDESLRAEMRLLLRRLHRELGMTTLFVTHDQVEAAMVADRVALLLEGRLAQVGSPLDFYTVPSSPDVAHFFGWQLLIHDGKLLAFRPEHAVLRPLSAAELPRTGDQLTLPGEILAAWPLGLRHRYRIRLHPGVEVEVEPDPSHDALPTVSPLAPSGERLVLVLPLAQVLFFPGAEGADPMV
ncbi:MAG: ABC transporter ATP-binding protein, partial [Blastocatellia bacterium]